MLVRSSYKFMRKTSLKKMRKHLSVYKEFIDPTKRGGK